jgi:hypothetical protein
MRKQRYSKETYHYKQIHSGKDSKTRGRARVIILISKFLKTKIGSYSYWSERTPEVRTKIFRGFLNVIGVYALVEGREGDSEECCNM